MATPEQAINKLKQAIQIAAKAVAQKSMLFLQGYIGEQFGDRSPSNKGKPNTTDKLRVISTKLYRGYLSQSADNETTYSQIGNIHSVKSVNKVPYAPTQEYGATISQNIPITQKMRKLFWAKWYAEKDGKYKAMALTKKTSFNRTITIPARPVVKPAIEKLKTQGVGKIQELWRKEVAKAYGI